MPCKKLSVSYVLTTSSDIISAVCKSMHMYIYLHMSSCMQDLAFWKIVRHPNFLPTGIMRNSLVDWTSVPDSHWEAHQVFSSFRHFGKSHYVPVCTLGCLDYLEKLAPHSYYFQSCGLWSSCSNNCPGDPVLHLQSLMSAFAGVTFMSRLSVSILQTS